MCTGRDLNELGKSIADLGDGKGSQKGKVEERLDGRVVSAETVLVAAVVDGNLDGYRGIDETDDSRGNTDVVRVAAIRGACESGSC